MQEAVLSPLATWQSFYVLVGTAAATLTGLLFVVITLVAGAGRRSSGALGAFTSPNVVHTENQLGKRAAFLGQDASALGGFARLSRREAFRNEQHLREHAREFHLARVAFRRFGQRADRLDCLLQ